MVFYFLSRPHPSVEIPLHVASCPLLKHLSVLKPLQAVELMPNHCTVLSFTPIISVRFLSSRSKQFCLNKKGFPIKSIFVVFAGNDNYVNKLINLVNSRFHVCGLFNKFWRTESIFWIMVFLKKVLEGQSWLSGPKTLLPALVLTQAFSSLLQILDVTEGRLLCLDSWLFLLKSDQSIACYLSKLLFWCLSCVRLSLKLLEILSIYAVLVSNQSKGKETRTSF